MVVRKWKTRIDYKVFHETGEEITKNVLQPVMTTQLVKVKHEELDCNDEINNFIEDNPFEV